MCAKKATSHSRLSLVLLSLFLLRATFDKYLEELFVPPFRCLFRIDLGEPFLLLEDLASIHASVVETP
jgi:hypothetical protein